jgi:hypothetical protein
MSGRSRILTQVVGSVTILPIRTSLLEGNDQTKVLLQIYNKDNVFIEYLLVSGIVPNIFQPSLHSMFRAIMQAIIATIL